MNNLYLIGSHDSLTYAPVKWYLKPIRFTATCLQVNYKLLYEDYNVRVFDIRVKFDKKTDKPIVCHGFFKFNIDVYEVLNYLNSKGNCYCRILLELNNETSDINYQELQFRYFCGLIQYTYKNIKFFGGRIKYSWKIAYQFDDKDVELDDLYSSVQCSNPIFKILPKRYAKKNNHNSYLNGTDKECLFIDYVNIK